MASWRSLRSPRECRRQTALCQACGSKDIHARPNWRGVGQVANNGPSRHREAEMFSYAPEEEMV
jgi:hypothetical protein